MKGFIIIAAVLLLCAMQKISFSEEHLRQICYDRFFNDYIKFGYGKDDTHRRWEQRDMENRLFKQRKI